MAVKHYLKALTAAMVASMIWGLGISTYTNPPIDTVGNQLLLFRAMIFLIASFVSLMSLSEYLMGRSSF